MQTTISFEQEKLRDQAFKAQFYEKLAAIGKIKRKHTFIAYATNRQLVEELRQLYTENLVAYEEHYALNLDILEAEKRRFRAHHLALHALHREEIQQAITEIEAQLEPEDYQTNSKAAHLLKLLGAKIDEALGFFKELEEKLNFYKNALNGLEAKVWQEDYQDLLSNYQQVSKQILGKSLPNAAALADAKVLTEKQLDRENKVAQLRDELKFSRKLQTKLDAYSGKAFAFQQFQELKKTAQNRKKIKQIRNIGIAIAAAASLALLGLQIPDWLQIFKENRAWSKAQAEDTFNSYEDYLISYPHGKYHLVAQQAIMDLDSGSLEGLLSKAGISFDYRGAVQQGVPHGTGVGIFEDGSKYTGEWQAGLRNGLGTFEESNGNIYNGSWSEDEKGGEGKQSWPNGDSYQGNWSKGKRSGKGTLIQKNGNRYVGNWRNDQLDGSGTFSYADKSKYEGNWRNGLRHGSGTYYFADGSKYKGAWQQDKRHGFGEMSWKDGRYFQGNFAEDKLNGKGKMTWANGCNYNGLWKDGGFHGQGIFTSRLRESFSGRWESKDQVISLYDASGGIIRQGSIKDGLFVPQSP